MTERGNTYSILNDTSILGTSRSPDKVAFNLQQCEGLERRFGDIRRICRSTLHQRSGIISGDLSKEGFLAHRES